MPAVVRFSVVTIALLVLSLWAKAALFGREPKLDQPRLAADVAAVLTMRGYATSIEQRPQFPPIVTAVRGSCRIIVRDSSFAGQEMIGGNRLRLAGAGPIRTYYAGQYRARYPTIESDLAWRVQRELARLGIVIAIRPVLRVAAQPACLPPPEFADALRLHVR